MSARIAIRGAAFALATALLASSCGPAAEDTAVATVNAQYCAFVDAGKAYVSAFDSASAAGGVYTFAPAAGTGGGARYLYMTDTYSGGIYTYDPGSHASPPTIVASTTKNATGEIAFYEGIGYVCVGSGAGAGVYRFDPAQAAPTVIKVADYRPVAGTEGDSFQEMIVAPDGYLYAANADDGTVLRIDTSTDAIVATILASAGGTTGLAAGAFNGSPGVFVANTGGYDANWDPLPGSIDFIAAGATTATAVASALSVGGSIYPARLVQLAGGDLVATGFDHSYLVDIAGSAASVSELSAAGSSFGGLDIAYDAGLVYIPCSRTADWITYDNKLFIMDESGDQRSFSPVSVMGPSASVTNIAFYEDLAPL